MRKGNKERNQILRETEAYMYGSEGVKYEREKKNTKIAKK